MRLQLLFICLAYISLATPAVISLQASIAIIERELKNVSGALKRLTTAIQALDPQLRGDLAQQETAIESRSQEVINTLTSGASAIRGGPTVEVMDSLRLVELVWANTAVTETAMTAWINAKPVIVRAGGREPILNILSRAEKALDEFMEAIISKLPPTAVLLGRAAGQGAKAQLQRAMQAYRKE